MTTRILPPTASVRAPSAMVVSADSLATQAGLRALMFGGNAVDAAIATNGVLAVTAPHLCGMGGDLFALVHTAGTVHALNSTGRAGSGSDPGALRREGHTEMPLYHDIRTVTVPGCVDGWCALHERFGTMPLADLLAPAIGLAENGFPASPLLVAALAAVDDRARANLTELASQATTPGSRVARRGVAATLRAVAAGGRAPFYEGPFGAGLRALGPGLFDVGDLSTSLATWVQPLSTPVWGHVLHTIPPNSQGYLVLGAARIAEQLELPGDTDDARWAHLLIEAAIAAGHDRPDRLHEHADGVALVEEIAGRAASIDPERARTPVDVPTSPGDTTYLCVVDAEGNGVSLIQSNAAGFFGSWIVEPTTGVNLHNRGLGFNLSPGHPAELAPGRRPPHTLSPQMATNPDGSLAAVFGTMGGDAQPQVLLQVATRLLHHGQEPAIAVGAGRWTLQGPVTGFDTWTAPEGPTVTVEANAVATWTDALAARGHRTRRILPYDQSAGHAHAIVVQPDGARSGAADPRTVVGAAAGF